MTPCGPIKHARGLRLGKHFLTVKRKLTKEMISSSNSMVIRPGTAGTICLNYRIQLTRGVMKGGAQRTAGKMLKDWTKPTQ